MEYNLIGEVMRIVVDINILRNNIKRQLGSSLFGWIDVRNNMYNLGLNLLEDIFKINNIGVFTNSLKDAIKIRNVNPQVPIILTNIINLEQVYDVIINNITLVIKDINQIEEINELKLKDKLSTIMQINIDNYEDGIKIKNYNKALKTMEDSNNFSNIGVFTIVNNSKYNNLDDFKRLLLSNHFEHSFVIGEEVDYISDSFVSANIFDKVIKYELNVDKSYKLTKNSIFINKKIKKDCCGIRVKADNIDLSTIKFLIIDGIKYKTVAVNYNTLFLVGKNYVKIGKKIDVTNYIPQNCYTNWTCVYNLNGKIINFNVFD